MVVSGKSGHIFKINEPLQNIWIKIEWVKNHNHEIYIEFKKDKKRHLRLITDDLFELEGKMKEILIKMINFDTDPLHTNFFYKGTLHKAPGYHLIQNQDNDDIF